MSDGLVLNLKSAELVLTSTGGVDSLVDTTSSDPCPSVTEPFVGVTVGGLSLRSLLSSETESFLGETVVGLLVKVSTIVTGVGVFSFLLVGSVFCASTLHS